MADEGLIARLKKWLAVWTGERVRVITSRCPLEALWPKVKAWRVRWGMGARSGLNLSGADLSGADLREAYLWGPNL